ncbi:hypothetical protein JSQ81_14690 [Sporosarcina sp. Marseille-Q4063]|uniref:hypothetical protein n=1 Tax=Sporosarcina sp. Marseille-Q4063 TaxID=2810514 RepID=UPI001BB02EB9|nr:hypothetical protein [Sporosarcina sp. Marseille-Q4063]QUW21050.1 hypothetical protein JSQ81_14690 [Sporosarcina sp. Marseille-Q4063]
MKRMMTIMSTFLTILLISGCVSIPLTDGGSIEISADGLTIIPTEDDGGDVDIEEESVGKVKGSTTEIDEDESVNEENESENPVTITDDEENESTDLAGQDGLGGCAHEFYLLKNRLPDGFPIPECTYITVFEIVEDQEDHVRMMTAQYHNFGSTQEAHDDAKNFFSDLGYAITNDEVGVLSVKKNGIQITLTKEDLGSDSLLTGIQYRETPIIQYKVIDSFINLTENGHGKCSDEYYTSLSLLPEDFPLAECAKTTFIVMENFDAASNSAAFYKVDGIWADHYNAFVAYAEANNFTITQDEGLATQGELSYMDGDTIVYIAVEKIDKTKTDIHINVSKKF